MGSRPIASALEPNTCYIDTSQKHRHYLIIKPRENTVELWRDLESIERINIRFRIEYEEESISV